MRIQWRPNIVRGERRICLTRIRWERGAVGDGTGYSAKLSISLKFAPHISCIGLIVDTGSPDASLFYFLPLPCLAFRIRFAKSFGGRFA